MVHRRWRARFRRGRRAAVGHGGDARAPGQPAPDRHRRREQSRYGDLLTLARWFAEADDATAHAPWASAFGLYSCRHLGFAADDDADPVPPTASWWRTPSAEVPVALRAYGARTIRGRAGRRDDYSEAKAARLAERERAERRRDAALAEIAATSGRSGRSGSPTARGRPC